jgi:hypothetical protein
MRHKLTVFPSQAECPSPVVAALVDPGRVRVGFVAAGVACGSDSREFEGDKVSQFISIRHKLAMFPFPSRRIVGGKDELVSQRRSSGASALRGEGGIVRFISIRHKPTATPPPPRFWSVGIADEVVSHRLSLVVTRAVTAEMRAKLVGVLASARYSLRGWRA